MKYNAFNETPNTRIFSVTSLLTAHHFTYNPDLEPYEEEYPFAQIFLTVEGSGTYQTKGKTYSIAAGDMVCRPANQRSVIRWNPGKLHFLLISFACTSEAMKAFEGAPIPLYCSPISSVMTFLLAFKQSEERLVESVRI